MAGRQPAFGLLGEDGPVRSMHGTADDASRCSLLRRRWPACSSGDSESSARAERRRVGELRSAGPGRAEGGRLPRADASTRPPTRSTRARPVPCRRPHTAVTIKVGKLAALADGHLLAVDSPTVRARLAEGLPAGARRRYVGGDQTTQRLSRFEAVWFGPSLEQADAGADWFRCDVVGTASGGRADHAAAQDEGRPRRTRTPSTGSAPAAPPHPSAKKLPARGVLGEALLARRRRGRPARATPATSPRTSPRPATPPARTSRPSGPTAH